MSDSKQERECIDCHKVGTDVEPTTTPDRWDFKYFDRCPPCHLKRIKSAERTMKRYPEAFTGRDPFSMWGDW